jgi:hypothetical protein
MEDFVFLCTLVPPSRPQIRFLFIGLYLCYALPSDLTSR